MKPSIDSWPAMGMTVLLERAQRLIPKELQGAFKLLLDNEDQYKIAAFLNKHFKKVGIPKCQVILIEDDERSTCKLYVAWEFSDLCEITPKPVLETLMTQGVRPKLDAWANA